MESSYTESRKVQRSGQMRYVYLPTKWCRRAKIKDGDVLSMKERGDGSLLLTPNPPKVERQRLALTLPKELERALINLIMACYVNPAAAFTITMERPIDMRELLEQKALAGLEFVEMDGRTVTYEASMRIREPDALLKTLVKKIRNLLSIMVEQYDKRLIEKYEEEVDRSKILIQKAVISALALNEPTNLSAIDMHYTLLLATELERITDYLIVMDRSEKAYLKEIARLIERIDHLLTEERLDYQGAAKFTKRVLDLRDWKPQSVKNAQKVKIKRHLQNVAEILLDWAVTKLIKE